ncbi:MAG: hypothetical protein KAW00_03405 [Dehalococcoidia bacterium]|nr:hypothetical protein [Dehalococcoidia bacterium]
MIIPEEIEKYLVKDEIIEKEFSLRGRFALSGDKVYATNKRLFIIKGNSIRDIDYNHISSIGLKQERSVGAVVVGSISLAAGVIVRCLELGYWWAWVLVGLGLMMFILGLIRTQFVELFVVGLPRAYRLSGYRSGLDALFRIVREKKV